MKNLKQWMPAVAESCEENPYNLLQVPLFDLSSDKVCINYLFLPWIDTELTPRFWEKLKWIYNLPLQHIYLRLEDKSCCTWYKLYLGTITRWSIAPYANRMLLKNGFNIAFVYLEKYYWLNLLYHCWLLMSSEIRNWLKINE